LIVLGKTNFGSLSLPDTTNTILITGDATLTQSQFGFRVLGLGQFYASTGNTLIVSAPGLSNVATIANEGRVYAFHGQSPAGNVMSAGSADQVLAGTTHGQRFGQSLANLGPLLNGFNSVGVGNPFDAVTVGGATGTVFACSGTPATGPLANRTTLYAPGVNQPGQMTFGGGFSGRNETASLIGDTTVDVAVVPFQGTAFDIVDGSVLPNLTSPVDAKAKGQVHVPFPSGWAATVSNSGGLLGDFNGDTYADFVLADNFGSVPGRVAIFW
jgi:hypothetical protein